MIEYPQLIEALSKHGSHRKAAKALGIAQSTFTTNLNRGKTEGCDTKKEREFRKVIDAQLEEIDKLRGSKLSFTKRPKHNLKKGSFCRFIFPDTHGSQVDPDAIAATLSDLEATKPHEVVMLGDHLECGGFLAQHHTLGYVAQTGYTFQEDVHACNQLLDEIQKAAPLASIDYLLGNHERRLESWCMTQSLKNNIDAEFLRKKFSASSVLSLEDRGIRCIDQGRFYDNVPVPATIKKGHCYFTHGSFTGQHAASQHVRRFGGNIVYGHTHRADSYVIRTVGSGTIGGWSPGCLCILQPLWMHTNPTEWSHGYGLQLVNPDGSFLHINVPIIDGKSYLSPLVQQLSV